MPIPRIELDDTVLMVIDFQEKLLPHIHEHQAMLERAQMLIRGCVALDVPVIVTEQYPQGLGSTVESITECLPDDTPAISKLKFSAYVEAVRRQINEIGKRTILLCGIETHVCLLQTALDLAQSGYIVFVAADATSSRRDTDKLLALQRLQSSGIVIVSTEMALFEIVREAGTDRFKKIRPIVR